MTDEYDSSNDLHVRVKKGIEIGDGIADLRSTKVVSAGLREAGFIPILEKDLKLEGHAKWHTPLAAAMSLQGFARSAVGRVFTNSALSVLETVGVAPKGTLKVQKVLCEAADNLVLSQHLKSPNGKVANIFTPMYLVVGEKPSGELSTAQSQ